MLQLWWILLQTNQGLLRPNPPKLRWWGLVAHRHSVELRWTASAGLSVDPSVWDLNSAILSASQSICTTRWYSSSFLRSKEMRMADSLEGELRKGRAQYSRLSIYHLDWTNAAVSLLWLRSGFLLCGNLYRRYTSSGSCYLACVLALWPSKLFLHPQAWWQELCPGRTSKRYFSVLCQRLAIFDL